MELLIYFLCLGGYDLAGAFCTGLGSTLIFGLGEGDLELDCLDLGS